MTPAPHLASHLAEAFARGAPVGVVNFHATPPARAEDYDRQFAAIAARFEAATEDALAAFLATGRWPGRRPGVILAFYNGYRDNVDVALPLLERHGLIGWFFVVTGYLSCPVAGQAAYALAHGLGERPEGRGAMTWDEARALDRGGHVVASHTRGHVRASQGEGLREEIVGAQGDFTRELGHPARALAWMSGGAWGEDPDADAAVAEAGHEFLVSNFRVQRLPRGVRPRP